MTFGAPCTHRHRHFAYCYEHKNDKKHAHRNIFINHKIFFFNSFQSYFNCMNTRKCKAIRHRKKTEDFQKQRKRKLTWTIRHPSEIFRFQRIPITFRNNIYFVSTSFHSVFPSPFNSFCSKNLS